jgi:hypothetical protein
MAEVKIPGIEGLKFRTTLGLDFTQGNNGAILPKGLTAAMPLLFYCCQSAITTRIIG